MKVHFVLLATLLLASGAAQAETFRWVDSSGKVHYGDLPPDDAAKVEEKKFAAPPAGTAGQGNVELGYEARRAQENFPVTLYYASNCSSPCQKARDFLNKRGVPFTEKLLQTPEEINEFTKQSGSDQSPTLQVGKTYLKAFEPGQWNSELDIAGYPKFAPYRPSAPTAPPAPPAQ